MQSLISFAGHLFSLLLVLYLLVISLLWIGKQQQLIAPLNRWILKKIGQILRTLARSLCEMLERFFRWLRSQL